MRAARFHSFGAPSVLRVDDVPAPGAPTGDQILVRVEGSSINGTDLGLRRGDLKIATVGRMPFVPGFDIAGEVIGRGPRVTAFGLGDRVIALLGHGGGGQAEHVVIGQDRAATAPASVPALAAAALPLAGLTALQALYRHAGLAGRRAPRVLVNGASGGIGSYGVQLAALAGAHVTAVASTDRLGFVTELGADEVLDRRRDDLTRLGLRWDVVLDAAGTLAFAEIRPLVEPGGVVVSTRPISADALRALARPWRRRDPVRFAAVMTRPRSQDLARLATLVDTGRLRPVLDRSFPLAEIAAAHRHAESGVRGKVVVDMSTAAR